MQNYLIDTLSSYQRPFFVARKSGGNIVTEGIPKHQCGHQIAHGSVHGTDGIFVEWEWDGERLVVSNDRYGIYPLFYSCYGGEIRISPSIFHVLAGDFPKTLNMPGLALCLRLEFFLGEETPFEHIHVLPPGSRLTWHDGKMTLEQGSRAVPPPASMPNTLDEAVEQYRYLFAQAIARRPPPASGFTLPLSGGRDSRHILFELQVQGHQPKRVVTVQGFPPIDDEDRQVAGMIARELDLVHDEVTYSPSHLATTLKGIELGELCGIGHAWLLALAAYLKAQQVTCIYDGLAGGVLSGGQQVTEHTLQLIQSGQTVELAEILLGSESKEKPIHSSFRSTFVTKHIPRYLAVERLAKELNRYLDQSNPLLSYIFWNRTRRYIAYLPFSLIGHVKTVYCPYLDHDLFDFLINLDPKYNLAKSFHDETISRSYPQFAHLPYAGKANKPVQQQVIDRYYRRLALESMLYLIRQPGMMRSEFVKTERLVAMLVRDLVTKYPHKAWYLRNMLYIFKLERLSNGVNH